MRVHIPWLQWISKEIDKARHEYMNISPPPPTYRSFDATALKNMHPLACTSLGRKLLVFFADQINSRLNCRTISAIS